MLNRVCDALGKVYAGKQLSFSVDCPPDLSWRMDEGDAFEIFGNLLDNAAKWARAAVSIRVWQDAGCLRVRITDDGPGFGELQAVLQRHVRLDERVPGHGIGLAVVRDLVASHQGKLQLSQAELGGAQVDISFPGPSV